MGDRWFSFWQGLRVALRSLRRAPGMSLAAIGCLGLGFGVTAAVFSAVDRALVQPLPFREPERLITVHRVKEFPSMPLSARMYSDLARSPGAVQSLAAMTPEEVLIRLPDQTLQAGLVRVTGNLLPMLGVVPQRGRLLAPGDAEGVIMVSDQFWRARFGASDSILGRTIVVDGAPQSVVGVLPVGFQVPNESRMMRAEVWAPLQLPPEGSPRSGGNYLFVLGRLAPAATVGRAQSEFGTVVARRVEADPMLKGTTVRVVPLQANAVEDVQRPLLMLLAAVAMVLLIAGTNVASLLLARSIQRRREMAVRGALGASRGALVRSALLESGILTAIGLVLGLLIAKGGVATIGAMAADRLPQLAGLQIDGRVIALAAGLAVLVALLCGSLPAWWGARTDAQSALGAGRGSSVGAGPRRALGGLVVLEVALSLLLLIGAGLMLNSVRRLLANDPGFDPEPVLSLVATIAPAADGSATESHRFLTGAVAALAQLPGVENAGYVSILPYRDWGRNFTIVYEGQPTDDPSKLPLVESRTVTPGFFGVTRQRLLSGRLLRDTDGDPAAPVVVVNAALAARDFGGVSPVGKRFLAGNNLFATIVGVVSDIRNSGPRYPPVPEVYWNAGSDYGDTQYTLLLRLKQGDPRTLGPAAEAAVRSIDRFAAINQVMPMTDVIRQSVGRTRFIFSLMAVFAAVALILAVAGLYGVLSYAVLQQSRELGIRAALGGSSASIVRGVLRQGMRLVVAGAAIGLGAAFATAQAMETMVFGVRPVDPATWGVATGALLAIGALAALIPALRATRVDPMVALRSE